VTLTLTHTLTPTVTLTHTHTYTPTHTFTPTLTQTHTQTRTQTSTATATPPCGISLAGLQLEEKTTCGTNQANQTFEVINTGTTALNLNQITIKFWVDDTNIIGNPADTVNGAVNWGGNYGTTGTAVSGAAISSVNFTPACGLDATHQANWEITVSNTDTAVLPAGATWSDIQTAIHVGPDYVNFVPGTADWYSPCGVGGGSIYTNDLHYAIYYQGNLVTASGGMAPACRPVPACVSNTPTITNTRTTTDTPTETVTRTITHTPTLARTQTITATSTTIHKDTNTPTVTLTSTISNSSTNTLTLTFSMTPTQTSTVTFTTSITITQTPTQTGTITLSPTPTSTCCLNLVNQWGLVGTGLGFFGEPAGIAVDRNNSWVYVTDYTNNNVQKFTLAGSPLLIWGSTGTANGQFEGAAAVAVDSLGYVYVVDNQNSRVQKFDSNGVWQLSWPILPGTASGGGYYLAIIVDVQNGNNVYVSDQGIIQEFSSTGVPGFTFSAVNGTPTALTFNNADHLMVLSVDNITEYIVTNTLTQANNFSTNCVNSMGGPFSEGIGVNSKGNIYVFGEELGLESFASSGSCLCQYPLGATSMVGKLAIDQHDDIYITGTGVGTGNSIVKYSPCSTGAMNVVRLLKASVPSREGSATSILTPTVTFTPSPTNPDELTQGVVAVPNVSRYGVPVDLRIIFGHATQVNLSIYNIVGEMVYQTTLGETAGVNNLLWRVENQAHAPVASGLYIYVLQADDNKTHRNYTGKIAVIR